MAVNFYAHRGMILLMRSFPQAGPFCRDCGLATFREMTANTLVQGWWGVLSFFVTPVVLMSNLRSRWRLRGLAAPLRSSEGTPGLARDPGVPLFRRPQMAGLLLPVLMVWLAFSVRWSQGEDPSANVPSATDTHVGECVKSVMDDQNNAGRQDFHIITFVSCADPNDGRVVSVNHTDAFCPAGTSTGVSFLDARPRTGDHQAITSYCYSLP